MTQNQQEAMCCGIPLKANEDGLLVAVCEKCKTWYRLRRSPSSQERAE